MLHAYPNPFHSPQQNLTTSLVIHVTVLVEQAVGYSLSHALFWDITPCSPSKSTDILLPSSGPKNKMSKDTSVKAGGKQRR
jgi:hypothetical protein